MNGFKLQSQPAEQSSYLFNSWVLFIETEYDTNTSFHLGGTRSGLQKKIQNGAPIIENEHRVWKTFIDVDLDSDSFDQIGIDFENKSALKK